MRQLVPTVEDVDPVRTYLAGHRPAVPGRPWVAMSMIVSLDGATTVQGLSGRLGGPADQVVFHAVRAVADIVLVAAGTFRAERYGPVLTGEDALAARAEAGRGPGPARLAVVTSSLDLDLSGPAFTGDTAGSGPRPLILTTTDADPGLVRAASEVAEVRQLGAGRVDLLAALGSLGGDGADVVVCEGGPTLNGQLVDARVVDEICISLSPMVVGGASTRFVAGATPVDDATYEVASLLTEDGILFGRWVRVPSSG